MHGRIFVPGIEEKKRRWQFSSRMGPMQREAYSGRPPTQILETWWIGRAQGDGCEAVDEEDDI